MIDKSLAHYEIRAKIGSGGMGHVYRAHDSKLGRDVALKVLPQEMAADAEWRKRFEREAKAVAALKHPNIVTIYSVEYVDGVNFLTMELVEGQTLSQIIPNNGMPLDRFFDVAIALADAVSTAHSQGITHRDLKPANVMVDAAGRPKVLDFGLAKLLQPDESIEQQKTVVDESDTQEGRVLGTAAYMSPEQAEGKSIDHRSDIFSLGVVLFEMVTGTRPFEGETTMSTISKILRDPTPSITELKKSIPRHLGRIIKRCLEKDPSRRFQTALDLRNELEDFKKEVDSGELFLEVPAGAARTKQSAPKWVPLTLILVVVTAATALYVGLRPKPEMTTATSSGARMLFSPVTEFGGVESSPSIAPDGNYVVYQAGPAGNLDIFLQRIGGTKPINLTEDSPVSDYQAKYSASGNEIAFRSERDGGGIFVMGATGESIRRLTDHGYRPEWSPDGSQVVFETEGWVTPLGRSGTSELWVVDIATGEDRKLVDLDAVHPNWSPHGHRIAYWNVEAAKGGIRDIWTVASDGGDRIAVTQDRAVDFNPVWGPKGEFLYFLSDRGGSMNLWRVPIDEGTGQVRGALEPLTAPTANASVFDVASDGRIVFTNLTNHTNIYKLTFDASTESVVGGSVAVTTGSLRAAEPWASPDGEWVAFRSVGRQEDIYVIRADGTGMRKLTDDIDRDRGPYWQRDGERILFYSDRAGRYEYWSISPDGSGLSQLTETDVGQSLWFPIASPDGAKVAGGNGGEACVIDLANIPSKSKDGTLLPQPSDGASFRPVDWSPDGTKILGQIFRGGVGTRSLAIYDLSDKSFRTIDMPSNLFFLSAVWLGDNRRLLYVETNTIYLFDPETGKRKPVWTDTPGASIRITVSADDATVFYSRNVSEGDIWLATFE